MKTYLFVYGTLMKKNRLNKWSILLQNNSIFIDCATIKGELYEVNNFPGLKKGNGIVYGELYEVQNKEIFSELDKYEGFNEDDISNSLFVKEIIETTTINDQKKYLAFVYLFNKKVKPSKKIEIGKYLFFH